MTTHADAIKTIFDADTGAGGVAILLTGGRYTYEGTGGLGISLDNTPSAFDSNGLLKPCCVIKERDQVFDNGPRDDSAQVASYREVIEVWFYDDRDAGYATIVSVRARVYVLLQGKRVNTCLVRWVSNLLRRRDPALKEAGFERSDYEIRGLQP